MSEENTPQDAQVADEGQAPEAIPEANTETDAPEADVAKPVTVEDTSGDRSEAAREREARKKANREAQNLRERLKKFEEAEEARKQEAMSELEKASSRAEKLEQERDEASKDASSVRAELQSLRVKEAATSQALQAGAKQDRLDAVLRLTDLSEATLTDEDGSPDSKAIQDAIKATLKAYPEFKNGSRNVGGDSTPESTPLQQKTIDQMTDEEIADLSRRAQYGEKITLS